MEVREILQDSNRVWFVNNKLENRVEKLENKVDRILELSEGKEPSTFKESGYIDRQNDNL